MSHNDYNTIIQGLCSPFPQEVHKPRNDGHGSYIPIAYYLDRLNEVAGVHWSHERIGEAIFYEEDQLVHTMVKVTICGRSHFGEGFSRYQVDKQSGKIINRHYAIRAATKDGVRDAISFFGMGKQDSLNYESTRSNKSEKTTVSPSKELSRSCMKCGEPLSSSDTETLATYQIKFDYCSTHIPKHFLRPDRKKERKS
jgi:hypothetical protein